MAPEVWPSPVSPGPADVCITWLRIDVAEPIDGDCLSAEELERGACFLRETDRTKHRARNVFLRTALARCLDVAPAEVSYRTGEHGKPELDHPRAADWTFNLSHSDDLVLLAIARGRAVGVDVEAQRLRTEVTRMSKQVFTSRERAAMEQIAPDQQLSAFFRGWTRKEAALKATGEGFAREPRTVDVGIEARPWNELWTPTDEPILAPYSLADLEAPDGFSACLCAEGVDWSVE